MSSKYCPNCGKSQPRDAKFCSNCGHDFSKLLQRRSIKRQKGRQKRITLLVVLLGVVSVVIIMINQRGNHYETHGTTDTSSSLVSNNTDSISEDAESNEAESPTQPQTNNQLPVNVGPRISAAAITYYATKNSDTVWGDFLALNKDAGLTVRLSTDEELLGKLADKGQGMAYEVFNHHGITSDDKTNFIYTIDKNDDINIYYISPRSNADSYEPMVTVARQEIIDYLNNHGDASSVKSLGEKVVIEK